jgi:hypothetical protein
MHCSLCTLDTIHRLFFVTRLIIIKINKVQWVDFKLENVLVSLHSLKIRTITPPLSTLFITLHSISFKFSDTNIITERKQHLQYIIWRYFQRWCWFYLNSILVLTCSCQYSYNLMLTSNCMCRPYIDTNNTHMIK